jgi:hypothetical protein
MIQFLLGLSLAGLGIYGQEARDFDFDMVSFLTVPFFSDYFLRFFPSIVPILSICFPLDSFRSFGLFSSILSIYFLRFVSLLPFLPFFRFPPFGSYF